MAYVPRIVAFSGSARKDSYNKLLLQVAVTGARATGAEVTVVDLREYPMPLYDGDLEAASGVPEHARTLRALFKEHQGLLIASPEYNSSFSPLLKNTIDWLSRPDGEEPGLAAFRGKTAALVSASPGGLGGIRGLVPLRMMLGNIDILVIPDQVAVGTAHQAFDEHGALMDETLRKQVESVGAKLSSVLLRLHG